MVDLEGKDSVLIYLGMEELSLYQRLKKKI